MGDNSKLTSYFFAVELVRGQDSAEERLCGVVRP